LGLGGEKIPFGGIWSFVTATTEPQYAHSFT
jgi:hypothetical protein